MRTTLALALALGFCLAPLPATAGESDLSGSIALELRGFVDDPAFAGQLDGAQASVVLEPEWSWMGEQRRHRLVLAPFVRLDGEDDERSHLDLREAYWQIVWDDWELLAGVNKVFWGVTESRHLVDVINQTDAVEDIDEEDKLGQPMVRLSLQRGWGRLEAFALPGFRERTFPGTEGRLRPPLPVDEDAARFESAAGDERIDGALRYSHYIGDWDVGVHVFRGTGREPTLLPSADGRRLVPFYETIRQLGVDVQYTREAWLWKLETVGREGQGDAFAASVGGFEYTVYQVADSAADVGLLVEYLYDGRDSTAPPTAFDDDLFVGSRLALNDRQDTQILAGALVDRNGGGTAAFVEAERRLGSSYRVELETRWFIDVDSADALAVFEKDGFVTLRLSRYF